MDQAVLLYMIYKSMTAATRKKADAYAGPNESFPLYKNGEHLAAAWDLAGHADNPDEIRRNILAFAREHGLMSHLPLDAQQHEITKKALSEGDWLAAYEAVTANEGVLVAKCLPIQKAWTDDSGVTNIEGWISTEDQDIERDVVPPEAFKAAVDGYMALGGPITTEHQMKPDQRQLTRYPVGHMQAVALVRDGQIFKAGKHPTDPADFQYFPGTGTGVYGRGILTDELAGTQVAKGNVRGFSWVGMVRTIERLPGGGRKFISIDPWRESTIAAFPVNSKAVLVAAS